MAIDFVGSALSDFDLSGSGGVMTAATSNISAAVDEGVNMTVTKALYIQTPSTLPVRNPWHCTWYMRLAAFNDTNYEFLQFFDTSVSTTTPVFQIRSDNNSNSIHWYNLTAFNGTSQAEVVALSNFSLTPGTLYRWDVECFIDDTTGYIRVYVDGGLLMEWTGDTNTWTATGINQIRLSSTGNSFGRQMHVSGLITGSTSLLGKFLVQNDTLAAGTLNTAASGTIADIDETGYSDADFIQLSAAGQALSFTTNLPTAYETGHTIHAVAITGRHLGLYDPPLGTQLGVRIGGANYLDAGTSPPTTLTPFTFQRIMETNPATAAAWTVGAVDGLEQVISAA